MPAARADRRVHRQQPEGGTRPAGLLPRDRRCGHQSGSVDGRRGSAQVDAIRDRRRHRREQGFGHRTRPGRGRRPGHGPPPGERAADPESQPDHQERDPDQMPASPQP